MERLSGEGRVGVCGMDTDRKTGRQTGGQSEGQSMTDDSKITGSRFRSACTVFIVQQRFYVFDGQEIETKQFALANEQVRQRCSFT